MPGLPIARPVVFPLAHVGAPEGVSPHLLEATRKEKKAASDRARRKANPEKHKAADRARYAANRGKKAARNRLSNTGWTTQAFEAAWAAQGGCCSICRIAMEKSGRGKHSVHADHCHIEGKPRGLLCHRCNTGLGRFQDQPERLRAAIAYLENHAAK